LCVTWAVAVVLSGPLCPRRPASGAAKLPLNGHSGPLKVWRALLARQLENPPGREALGGSNPSPSALRSGNFASRLESIARRQNSKLRGRILDQDPALTYRPKPAKRPKRDRRPQRSALVEGRSRPRGDGPPRGNGPAEYDIGQVLATRDAMKKWISAAIIFPSAL